MYYGAPKGAPHNYCMTCHKATGSVYEDKKTQTTYICGVCGKVFTKLKSHHGNGGSNKNTNKL